MASEGLIQVIYCDNALTHRNPAVIVVEHGVLHEAAKILQREYRKCIVQGTPPICNYLINGTIVQTGRISNHPDVIVDEISFIGDSRDGIDILASRFALPEITKRSFVPYIN